MALQEDIADSGVREVKAVSCESGMEGRVGTVAHCDVDAGNMRLRRTVEVSDVNGLMMSFELVPPHSYEPKS